MPDPFSHSFKREERLKSRKVISRLFNREGASFSVFPLRMVYLETVLNSRFPVQFTVSIPKRSFPKAVDRNRIRRQLKELYRLNKQQLYTAIGEDGRQFAIMLIYTGRKNFSYDELEGKMKYALKKLGKRVNEGKKS